MGCSVNARCRCGYEEFNLLIGGGMMNFETYCAFPVFCRDCDALTSSNLLARRPCCSRCGKRRIVAYDDAELKSNRLKNVPLKNVPLKQADGAEVVVSWNVEEKIGRVLVLTDGEYYCPRCRQFTLRFEEGGLLWD